MHLIGSRMSPRLAMLAVITLARKEARARGRWTPIPGKSGMARGTVTGMGFGGSAPGQCPLWQVRVGRFGKGPFELKLPLAYC